jgi:hypothetical protein
MAGASIFYDTEDDMMDQVFCVPIYARWKHGPRWSFRGIVLAPVEGQRLSYRRIVLLEGLFDTEQVAQTFFSKFEKRSATVV